MSLVTVVLNDLSFCVSTDADASGSISIKLVGGSLVLVASLLTSSIKPFEFCVKYNLGEVAFLKVNDSSLITIGSGSGFYINNKGYALTNNHVVDICAQSVAIIDGKETLFRVVATDKTNDVAVLKTDYRSRNFIPETKRNPLVISLLRKSGEPSPNLFKAFSIFIHATD